MRLPIPLCFLFATWLLWRYARRWFYLELLLLLPTLLWFVETVNKSSRYMALIAPMLAFAFGAAVAATRVKGRWRTAILVASGFVIVAQLGANLLLLRGASKANYNRVGALLDASVPAGEPAYGTITFWLAMRKHPYISQERTTPEMAAHDYGVHYFILGDRMMAEGNDWDADYYERTRKSLADIQAHGTLVRSLPDPYYGAPQRVSHAVTCIPPGLPWQPGNATASLPESPAGLPLHRWHRASGQRLTQHVQRALLALGVDAADVLAQHSYGEHLRARHEQHADERHRPSSHP